MSGKLYQPLIKIVFCLSLALMGCGGGGGGGGGGGDTATAEIDGVVSGTTIIAVVDGEIVASQNTSDRMPDVDRDGDGIDESFSFTLSGIPVNSKVRIYLVQNGEIFPLYFDSDGDGAPDTNVLSLSSETVLSLGYVDTNYKGQDHRAIPENNPADSPDVVSEAEDPDFPDCLNQPDTSGLTLDELISEGFEALKDGWVLRARAYFEAAENLAGSAVSNDADTARFFYALTRIAALGFDAYSDGIPNNGLNTLGDILDGFGVPADDTQRSNLDAISLPDPLPADSPTGNELQSFLDDVVRPELVGAIDNLDAVSQAFNTFWIEPFDCEIVESDFGDVLFFRALFKGALASIFAQNAYDLDADIDATENNNKTIEQFLLDEFDFLTLGSAPAGDLNSARNIIDQGLDDLDSAIVWMNAETDFQEDDFINLGDATAQEINKARADIVDARNSLDRPTQVGDNNNPGGFLLDMSVFFDGLDLRDPNLLPAFSGDKPRGLFPDPTVGGVFGAGIDLNEDTDPADGDADILKNWPF